MVFKVAADAGYGGFGVTPGKRSPEGEYEWDFNNKVILAFEDALKQYDGEEFLRTDDRTGPLMSR
jgi:N-acetylmuramoyl-L-alanine amidase